MQLYWLWPVVMNASVFLPGGSVSPPSDACCTGNKARRPQNHSSVLLLAETPKEKTDTNLCSTRSPRRNPGRGQSTEEKFLHGSNAPPPHLDKRRGRLSNIDNCTLQHRAVSSQPRRLHANQSRSNAPPMGVGTACLDVCLPRRAISPYTCCHTAVALL